MAETIEQSAIRMSDKTGIGDMFALENMDEISRPLDDNIVADPSSISISPFINNVISLLSNIFIKKKLFSEEVGSRCTLAIYCGRGASPLYMYGSNYKFFSQKSLHHASRR